MEDDVLLKGIAKKVRELREAKTMSLERMSTLSGIAVSKIALLESGQLDVDILSLNNIANTLEVNLKKLL